MNTMTEDQKAELSYYAYRNPPVTDLEMVAQFEYFKERRNTKDGLKQTKR